MRQRIGISLLIAALLLLMLTGCSESNAANDDQDLESGISTIEEDLDTDKDSDNEAEGKDVENDTSKKADEEIIADDPVPQSSADKIASDKKAEDAEVQKTAVQAVETAQETSASASGQVTTTNDSTPSAKYTAGTYTGSGVGFCGNIQVSVTVSANEITAILIGDHKEDAEYMVDAKKVVDKMLSSQSTSVDTVSGATFSSQGIIDAVKEALGKASV